MENIFNLWIDRVGEVPKIHIGEGINHKSSLCGYITPKGELYCPETEDNTWYGDYYKRLTSIPLYNCIKYHGVGIHPLPNMVEKVLSR